MKLPLAAIVCVLLVPGSGAQAQPAGPRPSRTYVYREVGGDSLRAYVFLPPGRGPADRSPAIGPDALVLWSPALDLVNDGWFTSKLRGRATAADLSPARHVGSSTPPTSIVHGERDNLTPVAAVRSYCAALAKLGRPCDLHVYPGLGHLLTRNLANQEGAFDPDPKARADGIRQHHRFLRRMGFVTRR